jgi:hypothetical protein
VRFYRQLLAFGTLLDSDIVEADQELQRLDTAIHCVDSLLTYPYFDAGFKTVEGGRLAALRRHGTAAEQAAKGQKICAAFDRSRANGKSKTQAQKMVAKKFGISTRTVRNHLSWREKIIGKTS